MLNPFFSVIIPTLNEEKFLPVILRALTFQTFRDFELLVVDAKSEDKTRDIFIKFRNSFPRTTLIVSSKKNLAYQRNLGAKSARGKYLIFFDADVNIDPNFLGMIYNRLVKNNDLLVTTKITPDSHRVIDKVIIFLSNFFIKLASFTKRPFIGGYNTIVKKGIFRKLKGFDEKILLGEDYAFSLKAMKNKIRPIILKEPSIIVSLRRFRSEGRLSVFLKHMISQIYIFFNGPMTHPLFDYPMGGHVHS